MISTDGIGLKATELISPANNLKFNVLEKKHKEKIVLQLRDIRSKQKIDVKDKKRTNFSILSTTQKNRVGAKKKMPPKIINEIKIGAMQSFKKYDKLNTVEVSVKDSEVNTFLSRFKRYKYRLIIDNLLLSCSLTKDTNVILIGCNGLSDAKESLINGKTIKTLGVVNINQIESWDKLKGKSKWVIVVFNDSELDPTSNILLLDLRVPTYTISYILNLAC